MKFVVDRDPFLEALQRVAKVAQRGGAKTLIPILSHIRIDAGQRRLRIVANDSSRELAVELVADISKPGATTVSARALLDFVANGAGGEQVELEGAARAGDRLTVRAGQARAMLFTLPAEDFPVFTGADADPDCTVEIEGPLLADALAAVAYAQAGSSDQRAFLQGIYLHRQGSRSLVAVATDGHRLSRAIVESAAALPDFPGTIVPAPAVEHARALAERSDTVEIGFSETLLRFTTEGAVFTTKLIDGTYPDYSRVVPEGYDKGFDVNRENLLRAAKRCSAIISEKGKPLKLSPADGTLSLLGRGDEMGEISDVVDAETTTRIPVGFNAAFLAATLEALEGETIQARYADAGGPVLFTDPADPTRLQVLMPMRV